MDKNQRREKEKEKRQRVKDAKKNKTNLPEYSQPVVKTIVTTPISEPTKKQSTIKEMLGTVWGKAIAFLGSVGIIIAIIQGISSIIDSCKSTRQKYQEENLDTGFLTPLRVSDVELDYDTLEFSERSIFNQARKYKDSLPPVKGVKIKEGTGRVFISVGSGVWFLSRDLLEQGIKIYDPVTSNDCVQTKLNLILHKGRIYASAEFRDLQKGEIVGSMQYNHWKVYIKNQSEYNYEDDRLEVKDKQGYVIFSILFSDKGQSNNGVVAVSGYFISPNSVLIVNTDPVPKLFTSETKQQMLDLRKCISKDSGGAWKHEAENFISKIKSVFEQPELISF